MVSGYKTTVYTTLHLMFVNVVFNIITLPWGQRGSCSHWLVSYHWLTVLTMVGMGSSCCWYGWWLLSTRYWNFFSRYCEGKKHELQLVQHLATDYNLHNLSSDFYSNYIITLPWGQRGNCSHWLVSSWHWLAVFMVVGMVMVAVNKVFFSGNWRGKKKQKLLLISTVSGHNTTVYTIVHLMFVR